MTLEEAIQLAIQRRAEGNPAEAQAIVHQILAQQPNHPEALHQMGLLAQQAGRPDVGVEMIRRAIAANPSEPAFHINLGVALDAMGLLDEAIAAAKRALELRPEFAEALSNLGDAYCRKGEWDQTIEYCRKALAVRADLPQAQCNLGIALVHKRQYEPAIWAFEKAIALRPTFMQAYNNRGSALLAMGKIPQAMTAFRWVMTVEPKMAETYCNYGDVMVRLGDLDQAVRCYQGAIAMQETLAHAHHKLAGVLCKQGRIDDAIRSYNNAHQLLPHHAGFAGDRLAVMQLHPGYDPAMFLAELKQWDQNYAQPLRRVAQSPRGLSSPSPGTPGEGWGGGRSPINSAPTLALPRSTGGGDQSSPPIVSLTQGRIRIGYVSADFREHYAGWSLLPLLGAHDRSRFEIFGYSSVVKPDAITEKISASCDVWRDIYDRTDEQAAELIAADGIDVLVDLSLHGEGNRLLIFARKPAANQVSYLGYPGTTGMAAMDYRLSDPYLDPLDGDESIYSEKTIRLPRTYWCYQPAGATPAVAEAPAAKNGYVTFGCLASFAKSAAALEVWGELLGTVAESRLILNCPDGTPRERVMEIFAKYGVMKNRLRFVGEQPWEKYIQTFQEIDIALDPFPYGGALSTCDAIWMSVPVVSLPGRIAVGRAGRSILSNLGLGELVARDGGDYLRIARETEKLIALRPGLRERMRNSPLMDLRQFAKDIEAAFGEMVQNGRRA